MLQIISKIKDDLQVVLLLSYYVGHPVATTMWLSAIPTKRLSLIYIYVYKVVISVCLYDLPQILIEKLGKLTGMFLVLRF